MNRVFPFFVLLVAVAGTPLAADACPVSRAVIVHRQAVVVQRVQAVAVVPVAVVPVATVFVPTYAAAYSADGAAFTAEVRGLRQAVERLSVPPNLPPLSPPNGKPVPTPPVPPPTPDQGQVGADGLRDLFVKRCAGCHQGDTKAAKLGGAQVLLENDGTLPPFSPAELNMIKLYSLGQTPDKRQCPPGAPLPKGEQDFVAKVTTEMRLEIRKSAQAEAAKLKDK